VTARDDARASQSTPPSLPRVGSKAGAKAALDLLDPRWRWVAGCAALVDGETVCGWTENVEAAHDIALDMSPGQQATFEQAEKGVPLCRRCHRKLDAAVRRARRARGM
jgi:hypothetical protein